MKVVNCKQGFFTGFTIIELMITIAVAAVILGLGVPSFQGLMERNLLTSNINQFISSLAFTRSEAIKRNQRVLLCATNNGTDCANTGYENGWIIFVDANANGTRDAADENEEIIWVNEPLAANLTLRGNNGCCTNTVPYMASGRIAGIPGSIYLCMDNDTTRSRQVTIIMSGRVRLDQGDADQCTTS